MTSLMDVCMLVLWGLLSISSAAAEGGWRTGRATLYGEDEHGITDGFSIHEGSCQYGKLDKNVGTGWDIAAMSDQHPEFQGSCGRCFELACEGMKFSDNYGEVLDKTDACHDSHKTVIVTVVDACPCNFPKNPYSNKRWCCGDMDHFDISSFAFEKLAPRSEGVIGLKYRPVPCPSYEEHLPTEPENIQVNIIPNSLLSSESSTFRVSRTSTSDSTSTKHTSTVVVTGGDQQTDVSQVSMSDDETGSTTVIIGGSSSVSAPVSDRGTTSTVIVGGAGSVSIKTSQREDETSTGNTPPSPVSSSPARSARIAELKAKVKAKAEAAGIATRGSTTPPPPASPVVRKPAPRRRNGERVSRTSSTDTTSTHVHWSGRNTWSVSEPQEPQRVKFTAPKILGNDGDAESDGDETTVSGTTQASQTTVSVGGSGTVSVSGGSGAGQTTTVTVSGSGRPAAKSETRISGGGGLIVPGMNPPSPPARVARGRRVPANPSTTTVFTAPSLSVSEGGQTHSAVHRRVSRSSRSDTSSTTVVVGDGSNNRGSAFAEFSVPRIGK